MSAPLPRPSERERWLARRESGWASILARLVTGLLACLALSGLAIELLPFSVFIQHSVLVHTLLGLVLLPLLVLYAARHIRAWSGFPLTQVKFTGWAALAMAAVCALTGVVLTVQGLFGTRIGYPWRLTHEITTYGLLLFLVPHLAALVVRERRRARRGEPEALLLWARIRGHAGFASAALALGFLATAALSAAVQPVDFDDRFPEGYDRETFAAAGPFAPSLASTATGGALDARSLSGSAGCGTSGCHEQIYREWQPSAHRYAAMDVAFQAVQKVMAQQNGPTSTRYCGGCHDPISLFSGTKDLASEGEALTAPAGHAEGVSCLACHGIRETDVQGNANYVIARPERYVWELREGPLSERLATFLLRTYPDQHVESLSRRMFKTPEFCAACHKQFIDEQVNKVGWVQLQNQYDNWKASRWNHPGDPSKTLECRECHMPLVDSRDPAAGDAADFNRTPSDRKHRSHRFLGANQLIPRLQGLEGGEEHVALTERWLRGELEVPEIAERWREGPAVPIELEVPARAIAGERVRLGVHILNNKVGHDFPTGPLDIIQAWVEVKVTDETGEVVFHSGLRDERNFVETGTFMFKAEPVDRYGNLIDRHNLWEMVGVRFKRSLFPGAAEAASYDFLCPTSPGGARDRPREERVDLTVPPGASGKLLVEARLNYRKIDQYLLNFIFGEDCGLTAPVTVISTARAEIVVVPELAQVPQDSPGAAGGQ